VLLNPSAFLGRKIAGQRSSLGNVNPVGIIVRHKRYASRSAQYDRWGSLDSSSINQALMFLTHLVFLHRDAATAFPLHATWDCYVSVFADEKIVVAQRNWWSLRRSGFFVQLQQKR
jgi:hypothetical protein